MSVVKIVLISVVICAIGIGAFLFVNIQTSRTTTDNEPKFVVSIYDQTKAYDGTT